MKKHLGVFLFLLVLSSSVLAHTAPNRARAPRANPILRFVAQIRVLREIALYTLIEERCYRYMQKQDRNSCFEAVDQKITLLDFDLLLEKGKTTPILLDKKDSGSFVFVAFKKDFLPHHSRWKF